MFYLVTLTMGSSVSIIYIILLKLNLIKIKVASNFVKLGIFIIIVLLFYSCLSVLGENCSIGVLDIVLMLLFGTIATGFIVGYIGSRSIGSINN